MAQMDEEILGKYLDGSTSEQENAAIESWLSEDSEHRLLFEKVRAVWQKSQDLEFDDTITFDKSAAWKAIQPRMQNKGNGRTLKFWLPAVAASVLLVSLLALISIYLREEPRLQTITATTNNQKYTLPDGSVVYLKSGSSIDFKDDFESHRNLSLTGTAYFDVYTDSSAAFTILGTDFNVVVLGTEFMVSTEGNESRVGVTSGSVAVIDKSGQVISELTKNQSITYSRDKQSFNPVSNLNPNILYWQSGVLEFDKRSLEEVLLTLESVFGVDIQFDSREISGCLFSGRFADADLQDILDQLSISLNLRIERTDAIKIVDSQCQ